jgi:hypothetical protein
MTHEHRLVAKGLSTNSSDYDDIYERQGGATFHSHKNLDLYAFIYGEQNLTTILAIVEEIRDVDKLLDFKHDKRNISRVRMKALEDTQKSAQGAFCKVAI